MLKVLCYMLPVMSTVKVIPKNYKSGISLICSWNKIKPNDDKHAMENKWTEESVEVVAFL
jgi:hypothetical protein